MRLPGAASLAALVLFPEISPADPCALVLQGDPANPVTARVRTELESLGHHVLSTPMPDACGRVTLSLDTARLHAVVVMRDRPPSEVTTLTTTQDAMAVFALRVGEAVRAGLLVPTAPSVATPVPPPTLPVPRDTAFGVAVGARLLAAPGGVAAMVLPAVTLRWSRRVYASLSLAPWSWGGAAPGPSSLRVFSVALGAGVALYPTELLRVDVGVRLEYLDLTHVTHATPEVEQRDGVPVMGATASVRWRGNTFFALRGEATAGVSFREVLLVSRDKTVAQWGRPLVGAEIDAEFLF